MTNGTSKDAAAPGLDRPTHVRWLIFTLACAVSWLLYLHRYSWGVIRLDLKEETPQLTDGELGWLDGLFSATYALGQVPGGLAGDLIGPRAVLSVLILSWSGCVGWLGWARGFWSLGAIRAVFGLAQAGAYPNLSKVTRSWFPLETRTTVQGIVASLSGRAGGACASLLVATVLMGMLHLTWREALVVLGGTGMFFGLGFVLLFRNSPREHPWSNEAEQRLVVGDAKPSASVRQERFRLTGTSSVTLGALLVYSFASTFADTLYVNWIPQFLRESKGQSLSLMGIYAGLPLWGGALGGAVGGVLNDVFIRATGSRRWGRSGVAFTGKLLAAFLLAASVSESDGRWVMVMLMVCKFFGDWSLTTQWGTITDISGRASGTIFGLVNTAGAIAAFVAGPAMGYVKQVFGWNWLFYGVAAVYLLAAACWLLIDCTRRLLIEEPETPGAP
jgi:sugar phosphate permease